MTSKENFPQNPFIIRSLKLSFFINESHQPWLARVRSPVPRIAVLAPTGRVVHLYAIAVCNPSAHHHAVERVGVPRGAVPAPAGAQRGQHAQAVGLPRAVEFALGRQWRPVGPERGLVLADALRPVGCETDRVHDVRRAAARQLTLFVYY